MQQVLEFVSIALRQLPWFVDYADGGIEPASPDPVYEVTPAQRKAVFKRDGYMCRYCGSHDRLCADHVKPQAKGGKATMDNLQTLCNDCNIAKGSKYPYTPLIKGMS